MQSVYFLQYNNYYNRLFKRYETIEEYINNENVIDILSPTDFMKGDSVNTEIIMPSIYAQQPDYCVVYDTDSGAIESRWFIMETYFDTKNQYKAQLYRDLIADFYTDALTAPAFIEKATLARNNSLIYNNENMGFNQIKTDEWLLKDATRIPWIVGYVARNRQETTVSVPTSDIVVNYSYTSFGEYTYNTYSPEQGEGEYFRANIRNTVYGVKTRGYATGTNKRYDYSWGTDGSLKNPWVYSGSITSTGVNQYTSSNTANYYRENATSYLMSRTDIAENLSNAAKAVNQNWDTSYNINSITNTNTEVATNAIKAEDGKVIKVGDKYYKIRVVVENTSNYLVFNDIPFNGGLGIAFQNVMNTYNYWESTSETAFQVQGAVDLIRVYYDELSIDAYQTIIPVETAHLSDAPYDMFAIPYGKIGLNEDQLTFSSGADMLRFAQALQLEYSSSLYDLQLVPFCPISSEAIYEPQGTVGYSWINLNYWGASKDKYVQTISGENGAVGAIFWCDSSSFQKNLKLFDKEDQVKTITIPSDATEFKVAHECDQYRICSPNYASSFDIKATSNEGLGNFVATCSYKPFTPYIKVAPAFNGLYGSSFDDARGLICGGDFSLPRVESQWQQYELNNKNYQIMFDRQIENLEFNNKLNTQEAIVSGVTGALSAGVTTGAIVGQSNPYAGIAAGLGAAAISGAAAAYDVNILKKRQAETLDYTKDLFGYQLGNIQARPYTLTKVSSFNRDNKIFPFVEYYTATDTEKQALRDKITYNGMTVMVIGTIENFKQLEPTYIKARLIRLDTINADFHEASTLAEELNKGVFI